ncbi:MAG: KdsC family phosphatase [Halanaerobiales bacterium]
MSEFREELLIHMKKLKMFIMDVDGTLTDGKIYLGNNGEEMKAFNVKDGMGINLLHREGIIPVIITGRKAEIVNIRGKELSITEIYQGIKDKLGVYNKLKEKYDLQDEEISFIGDDLNDLPIMKKVGISFGVNDGVEEVKNYCDYCASKKGGEGAVREVIDIIIESRKEME